VINMNVSASSVGKGETLQDTCRTLEAMHPDVVVIRHGASGAPNYVASKIRCSVINAGDGMHAHPTQALLDAFTMRRERGTLDNLVVAIVGDIAHSRVARSNAHLLKLFGCDVRVVGPRTLLPLAADSLGVRVFDRPEQAMEGADVVMVLRIQRERLEGALLPSLREYARTFGIGPRIMRYAKPDAIVMHPGPMNRGVEIESIIADGDHSVVLDQVEAGVAVRMALLYLLAGEAAEPQSVVEAN
jgi:aspartate carbamoyltransferase catalytic subunit